MQISNNNNIGMATLLQNNKTYVSPISGVNGNNIIVSNGVANTVAVPNVAGAVNNTVGVVTSINNINLPAQTTASTVVVTNAETGKKTFLTQNTLGQFVYLQNPTQSIQQQQQQIPQQQQQQMMSLPLGNIVTNAAGLAMITGANVGATTSIDTQGAFILTTSNNNNNLQNRNATITTTNLNGFQQQLVQQVSFAPTSVINNLTTNAATNTTRYFSQFAQQQPQQQQQIQIQLQPQQPQPQQQQQQQLSQISQFTHTNETGVFIKSANGTLFMKRNGTNLISKAPLKNVRKTQTILVPKNFSANNKTVTKTKVLPALQKIQPQKQQQNNTVFTKNNNNNNTIRSSTATTTSTSNATTREPITINGEGNLNGKRLIGNKFQTTATTIATNDVDPKKIIDIATDNTMTSDKNTPTNNDTKDSTTSNNNSIINANATSINENDAPEVDIVINNVVCSFSVRCHLNLRDIAQRGFNVEYRRENGMVTMKLRKPYTTASVWSSGRITCTGATSEKQVYIFCSNIKY